MDTTLIAEALSAAEPISPGRLQILHCAGGITIINDAFNANAESMAAGLRSFASYSADRRMVAVLGEMRELGPAAQAAHHAIGQLVSDPESAVLHRGNWRSAPGWRKSLGARPSVMPELSHAIWSQSARMRDLRAVVILQSQGRQQAQSLARLGDIEPRLLIGLEDAFALIAGRFDGERVRVQADSRLLRLGLNSLRREPHARRWRVSPGECWRA